MKSIVCGLVIVAGMAASASASVVFTGRESRPLPMMQASVESAGGDGLRVVNENYDNWRSGTSVPAGVSNLLGLYRSGGNEIADDLTMVAVGAGLLDTMGLNVANAAATGGPNLITGAGAVRFYDGLGNFINGFGFNLPNFGAGLAPGGSSRISFAAGALTSLNIFLPANCYVSIQFTAATGIPLADMGLQIRGPINTGTSTDLLIDVTNNVNVTSADLGGALANTGLFIKTNDVPAPGAFALLGLGGLIAGRRRR